jgi:putative NADPH-quinone reductase
MAPRTRRFERTAKREVEVARKIVLIDGHPDPDSAHLDHALAKAYAKGAAAGGHEVRRVRVADLDFPLLRRKQEFDDGNPPADIAAAQRDIGWADHLVLIYPLWLGTLPALTKGFLEQVLRPDFAFDLEKGPRGGKLTGKSARVVVTMGMPALAYRWFYRAHSLKNLERNILKFAGIKPVRTTLFGGVESASNDKRTGWLQAMEKLGKDGA